MGKTTSGFVVLLYAVMIKHRVAGRYAQRELVIRTGYLIIVHKGEGDTYFIMVGWEKGIPTGLQ